MTGEFRIRRAEERDYPAITEIAGACFIGSIREYYGPGGAMAFGAYIQPSAIRARRKEEKDLVLLVAEREGETLGVAELRERNHLSMVCVAGRDHPRGAPPGTGIAGSDGIRGSWRGGDL